MKPTAVATCSVHVKDFMASMQQFLFLLCVKILNCQWGKEWARNRKIACYFSCRGQSNAIHLKVMLCFLSVLEYCAVCLSLLCMLQQEKALKLKKKAGASKAQAVCHLLLDLLDANDGCSGNHRSSVKLCLDCAVTVPKLCAVLIKIVLHVIYTELFVRLC